MYMRATMHRSMMQNHLVKLTTAKPYKHIHEFHNYNLQRSILSSKTFIFPNKNMQQTK